MTPKIRTKTQKEAQKSRDINSIEILNEGENDFRAALMLGFNSTKPEVSDLYGFDQMGTDTDLI